ncbi:MAG TPA: hypothetical protein PLV41_08380 [Miltoncostaeales bacterium]|nr:hypothetical protein [Miltoncostaeales bacterium]
MTTPLPEPLTAAITAVADALEGVDWLITGSVARALSGFAATPRDLDVEVAATQIEQAAARLGLGVANMRDPQASSRRAIGAIGTVELDMTAGLTLIGPGGILPPDFDLMRQFATEATVDGRSVPVAPLEEQIVRILVSGNEARRARFVRESPADYIARSDYVELRLAAARAAR